METLQHNFDVNIHIKSSNQKIKINQDFIEVNNTKIACKDVSALKYGVSLVGPKKKPSSKRYAIDLMSKDGKTLNISFNSSKVGDLLEEDHTYYYIMSGVWQYIKKPLINQLIDALNEQKSFSVADIEVSYEGIKVPYKAWFWGKTKKEILPWNQLKHNLDKGIVYVGSTSEENKKSALKLHDDWNAVCLNTLLHYLWQDNRRNKLAKGEKI
ncbi:hypothetical protein GS399_13970 [Pedobacter sp. HMF7647]|uniref:Uncharacterized protein n=1 Tax=Hufsiella arboris TaxID=2695275 RepID=A0A7K1YCI1_9SPHI|nr:hypothetical protein [Hufsiella arboris]MXV52081.1 hypothetical protein [Hufsiella arboris]